MSPLARPDDPLYDHIHLARSGHLPLAAIFGSGFFEFERIPSTIFNLAPPHFSVRLTLSQAQDVP